jgi:hypothetical protein
LRKVIHTAAVALYLIAPSALALSAKDGWVTFKISHNSRGKIEHQIELRTIKQEGPYKSFWTRLWVPAEKPALVFSANEQLFFAAEKYLVDCAGHRFGTDTVDSVSAKKEKYATAQTMHWASLDKFPVVAKTLCGEK